MDPDLATLWDYDIWRDEDGYHARRKDHVPDRYREVHAASPLELMREAVRNRVRVWVWESAPRRGLAGSGWSQTQDPR